MNPADRSTVICRQRIPKQDMAALQLATPYVDDVILEADDRCVNVVIRMADTSTVTGHHMPLTDVIYRWTPSTPVDTDTLLLSAHECTLKQLLDICPHLQTLLHRLWADQADQKEATTP